MPPPRGDNSNLTEVSFPFGGDRVAGAAGTPPTLSHGPIASRSSCFTRTAPQMIRMAWHAAVTYRIADGRGGQPFGRGLAPLRVPRPIELTDL